MKTMDDAAQWADLPHRAPDQDEAMSPRGSFMRHLGAVEGTKIRVVAAIPPVDFEQLVSTWKFNGDVPNPVLRSAAGLLGNACRIAAGVQKPREVIAKEMIQYQEAKYKDMELQLALAQASTASTPVNASIAGSRSVKLATCVDQANDMEATLMTPDEKVAAYDRYKTSQGDVPRPEEDLTDEQLAGLRALYRSGQVPYVDLAVWGPFGRRIQKKLKLSGLIMGANGSLQQSQLFGPPCLEEWIAGFTVFKTGSVMLGELTPSVCDHWMKNIAEYARRYGPSVWPMIYQAEVRARLEHLERVRRAGQQAHDGAIKAGGTTDFDPAHPWEWAFRRCADDVLFWRRELEEPALLVRSHVGKVKDHVEQDAIVDGGRRARDSSPPRDDRGFKRQSETKHLQKHEKKHSIDGNGLLTTNRRGIPLCSGFQAGQCESRGTSIVCPADRAKVHQCAKCLSDKHGSEKPCPNPPAKAPSAPKQRGKGGGKGKKGKGYMY